MQITTPKFIPKIVITIPQLSFKNVKPARIIISGVVIIIATFGIIQLDKNIKHTVKIDESKKFKSTLKPIKPEEEIAAERIEKTIILDVIEPEPISKIERENMQGVQNSYFVGQEYFRNKVYDKAIEEFKKVITLGAPSDKLVLNAFINLGNISDIQGNYSEAIFYYINVLKLEPNNPIFHYNLGLIYEHKNDFANAIKEYKIALKLNNNFIDAYTALFNLYLTTFRKSEANDLINYARAKNPNNSELFYNQALLDITNKYYDKASIKLLEALKYCDANELKIKILMLLSNIAERNKNIDKVIEYLSQILVIDDRNNKALENIAFAYISKREYDSAIPLLEKLIDLNKENYKYHLLLGNIYLEKNNFDEASEQFNAAEKFSPDNYAINYALGNIFLNKGFPNTAFNYFRKSINLCSATKYSETFEDINSMLYNSYIKIAPILVSKELYEPAIEAYNNALKLSPKDFIYYNLGLLYEKIQNYDEALKCYTTAIVSDYSNYDYNKSCGTLLFKLKKFDESEKYLSMALKNNPKDFELLFMLGYTNYNEGKLDEAFNYFIKTLDNNPTPNILISTYKNLGNILNMKNKPDEAVNYYLKGIELNPADGSFYYNTALAYINLKDYNKAAEYLIVALKYLPDEPKIHTALGNCYFEKGLPELAVQEFSRALAFDTSNIEIQYNLKIAKDMVNKKTNN